MELFHALGVALAPTARSWTAKAPREHFDLVGTATFSHPKANGTLLLSLDENVYSLLSPRELSTHAKHDLLRELTNQLIGRIKNRLLQFQLPVRNGLPSVTRKPTLDRQFAAVTPFAAYAFRTRKGELVVTVMGEIDEASLNYAQRVDVPKEGEFIEF